MAEVIKTAAIWNESEFAYLEANAERVLAKDVEALLRIVIASVRVKVCKTDMLAYNYVGLGVVFIFHCVACTMRTGATALAKSLLLHPINTAPPA